MTLNQSLQPTTVSSLRSSPAAAELNRWPCTRSRALPAPRSAHEGPSERLDGGEEQQALARAPLPHHWPCGIALSIRSYRY
jgi:hypothetical protein